MEHQIREKKKLKVGTLIKILKTTFQGFSNNNITTLSASLAYATLFSMIPFLSLLITIGVFFHVNLTDQLYTQLDSIVGLEVVEKLKLINENASETNSSTLATIISLGISIFGATTIFAEMQGSLNTIWGIKAIPKKGWFKYLKTRLLSFSLILIFAFILLVTFGISNLIVNLSNRFISNYPDVAESLIKITGTIINICVTTSIFTLIYKILPDAKIKSKDIIVGALVSTILFLIGQWAISLYISMSDVGNIYGAAAFMAILITWIYYSAIIIYIGAEFTQAWANEMGSKIFPDEFAVATQIIEIHKKEALESVNKIEIEK